jgi:signal transduction histidine kinase
LSPHVSRPPSRDVIGAAVVTVITLAIGLLAGVHAAHDPGSGYEPLVGPGYALVVLEGAAIAWRRRAPTTVLLVVFAIESGYTLAGYSPGLIYIPLITAFATAVIYGDRRVAYGVLVGGYLMATRPGFGHTGLAFQVGLASWLAALAAFAEIIRIRRRVRQAEAQQAERSREAARELARRRAGEERLRIARDLHDVLAHHLALITVQANAGLVTLTRDTERTEAALRAIKDSGNAALGELRSVLDLLRTGQEDQDEQDEQAPRDPTPAFSRTDDFNRLADGAKAAGLTVRTETLGTVRPLPGPVDRAAYRIVQETLTNAVRHAGPGTGIHLRVQYSQDELRLLIEDDGRGAAATTAAMAARPTPASPGGGNGLPGMRERAAALGGTLRAEPTTRGGFLVEAVFPTIEEPR